MGEDLTYINIHNICRCCLGSGKDIENIRNGVSMPLTQWENTHIKQCKDCSATYVSLWYNSIHCGPCIAKRKEARKNDMVDYVLTFEELQSIFEGMDISLDEERVFKVPVTVAREAHGFAQNGGVTAAVAAHVNGAFSFTHQQISNLDKKTVALLKAYGKSGKSPTQVLEVMACEGGCISGPSLHTAYDSGRKLFNDALKSRKSVINEEK